MFFILHTKRPAVNVIWLWFTLKWWKQVYMYMCMGGFLFQSLSICVSSCRTETFYIYFLIRYGKNIRWESVSQLWWAKTSKVDTAVNAILMVLFGVTEIRELLTRCCHYHRETWNCSSKLLSFKIRRHRKCEHSKAYD